MYDILYAAGDVVVCVAESVVHIAEVGIGVTIGGIIAGLVVLKAVHAKRMEQDDTDKSATDRSGLVLYTDARTGIQYVGSALGGLTPRLFPDDVYVIDRDA